MNTPALARELEPDGTVVLKAGRGTFRYRRLRPGALEVRIEGVDSGQFATATLDEIAMALVRERPLELFIDASAASMTGKLIQIYSDAELFEARKGGG